MTDEVRDISIVVRATQAIASLTKVSVALDDLQGATGKSDAQLKVVDRTINKAANTATAAARTLVILKNELKTMSKESTLASHSIKNLETRLALANKRISDNKTIISVQRQTIASLTADNTRLAESYNKVATAATRANAAGRGGRAGGATPKTVAPGVGGISADNQFANSLRYQLYDVAATFGILGVAATAAGTAVFRAGIQFDKNFANVVRTSQVTGSAVEWLKNEFLDLQSAIPVTSEDLATIGTLGAQMGVAAANLANFTEVTAKFAATSGVGVDEAATALSRLDELLPDVNGNYEQLASIILRTGVNAVATEQQIVRGTSQIAAMGRLAGLTTPEVVALASAMSSLGFSPELQRSVITSSFSKILTATATVTAQTEKFGDVLGITGKQFKEAWDKDALGTYKELLETIAGRGDAVTVLQDLGLASQRLTPNLLKLGQNGEVLTRALSDTTDEARKGTELQRQYGIIASTVSAKIQVLGQSWEALLVTLDESDTVIGPLVDGLTGILKVLRLIARTPGVSTLASIAGVIVTLTGITALGAAGLAALAGGYIALHNANIGVTELLAANAATMTADTAATTANTASKIANAEANAVAATAVEANTVAQGGNAAASSAAGIGLLKVGSGAITALPAILKFTGVIGLAVAALAGLVTLVTTAPDWGHDLQKFFNGIDTPEKTFEFDSSKLKKAINESKYWADQLSAGNPLAATGGVYYPGWGGALAAALKSPEADMEASKADLVEQVNALETMEEKYTAVNYIAERLGVTQKDLLTNILPDLGSELGDGAAAASEMYDETVKLEAAQAQWAAALGTSDQNLTSLMEGIQNGAAAFFDFGTMLGAAYEKGGGGLNAFISDLNGSVKDFEHFYADLGTLTQRGGVQLATLFAGQGPAAAQALTDSLKLNSQQIGQIEDQMALAAFYASEEFANTFSQNNAVLAQVWTLSGNNPQAVAAFSSALNSSMSGATIDPAVLAGLSAKFGFDIPVGMIPSVTEEDMTNAVLNAQAIANSQVVELPMRPMTSTSVPLQDEVKKWLVNENGHSIVLEVDPATEEGSQILNTWRANEYEIPIEQSLHVDTSKAAADIARFAKNVSSGAYGGPTTFLGVTGGTNHKIATGGLIHRGYVARNNYPKFATGAVLRGPGTGTSDSILARVSNGEAITRARAVRHYGPRMFEDINNMRFPKFAQGRGPVGYNPGSYSGDGAQMNVTVIQNYPTTRDPIKQLKQDAESVVAGIWN